MKFITFCLYKDKLIEKKIMINDNHFQIKFLLQKEDKEILDKLKKFKEKEIIKTTKRNAKILDSNFRKEIINLIYSRQTIKQALNNLQKI